jgi:hypothetical protein
MQWQFAWAKQPMPVKAKIASPRMVINSAMAASACRSANWTVFRRSLLEPFKLLLFAEVNSVNSALQPASLFQILIGQLLGFRQLSVDLGALLVELGVIPIFGNKL